MKSKTENGAKTMTLANLKSTVRMIESQCDRGLFTWQEAVAKIAALAPKAACMVGECYVEAVVADYDN